MPSTGGIGDLPHEDYCDALMANLGDLNCYDKRNSETGMPVLRLSVFQLKGIDASKSSGLARFSSDNIA